MLFVASERGGAKQLAVHLLNETDNEHVAVHEVRGFVSEDVTSAFKEAQAVAQGTRCRNFLFSVSLNPPADKDVPISVFEETIERIEAKTGLQGQPRVVVFHEKEGRRHAHCVWSRIDAETMTARNLPHFKAKLQDVSRDIHLEQDWKMPAGLSKSGQSDPRNFTLAEWQQCKRIGKDARELKTAVQDAWAISDTAATFSHALAERGLVLAKGDRRGHVAVTHEGEVLSIARYADKKAKEVRARLGEPTDLPSVDEAKVQIAKDMRGAFKRHGEEASTRHAAQQRALEKRRQQMVAAQRQERAKLDTGQKQRWETEARERAARLHTSGLKGLWQRFTGKQAQITRQNEWEAYQALQRDRAQKDELIQAQFSERRQLQTEIVAARNHHKEALREIAHDRERYARMERDPASPLQKDFAQAQAPPNAPQPPERVQETDTPKAPQREPQQAQPEPQPQVQPPAQPSHQERLDRLRQQTPHTPQRNRGLDFER
ncbi:relaxase [Amorphus sp. 3PC139-8]|uniref:relaxase/mobilization nuclease domain-containing protein n=1 Tax=Amorphus sp. 3PC139-8 TaxID=2735676 RepID=UPI00345CAE83